MESAIEYCKGFGVIPDLSPIEVSLLSLPFNQLFYSGEGTHGCCPSP